MINAAFITKDGTLKLGVNGHSNAAPAGQDTVCAGATTLAYTLAQCIRFMHSEGKLEEEPRLKFRKGKIRVECKPKSEHYAEALHTYYVAQVGMALLMSNYPGNVRVKVFDTSSDEEHQ